MERLALSRGVVLRLANQLQHALTNHTEGGGKGDSTCDTKRAIAIMLEKHGIASDMLRGSNWQKAVGDGKKTLFALPSLQEHIMKRDGLWVPESHPRLRRMGHSLQDDGRGRTSFQLVHWCIGFETRWKASFKLARPGDDFQSRSTDQLRWNEPLARP